MGAPASQTVTQEVDPWIRSGIQGLYSQANQYLNQTPYQDYPGSTVAGFQPFQNAAASFLSQGLLGQPLGFSTPPTYGPFSYTPFEYQMPTYSPYSGGTGGGTDATGGSGGVGQPYIPDEGEGGGTNGVAMAQMEPPPPTSIGDPTEGAYSASLGGWGRTGPYAPLPGRTDNLVPTEDELTPQQPTTPSPFQLSTTQPDAVTLNQSVLPTGPISDYDKTFGETDTFIPTAPPPAPPQSDYDKTFGETDTVIPTQPLDQPPLYPGGPTPSWSGAVQPVGAPTPGTDGGMYGGGIGPMSGQAEAVAAAQRAQELMGYTPESVAFNPYAAQSIAERGPFGSQQVGPLSPYEASTVSAQTGAGMMDAYLNPYEDAVVSQGIEDLNRARQIAGEQTYESAGRGAYGSDRSALLEAENTRNYLDQVSRFSNQMRSAGFDRAAGLAQQDAARALQASGMNQQAINAAQQFGQSQDLTRLLANQQAADAMTRFGGTQGLEAALANQEAMNRMGQFNAQGALQAALANQSAGLSGAGMNLGAAQALSGIGSQNLQNLLSGTNALMGMGGFAQNQAQQMINADIARYDQARNDPLRRFGLLQSIIGGMPVTMNTTQTMQPNLASQLGGGLLGVLGAAGGAGGFSSLFG